MNVKVKLRTKIDALEQTAEMNFTDIMAGSPGGVAGLVLIEKVFAFMGLDKQQGQQVKVDVKVSGDTPAHIVDKVKAEVAKARAGVEPAEECEPAAAEGAATEEKLQRQRHHIVDLIGSTRQMPNTLGERFPQLPDLIEKARDRIGAGEPPAVVGITFHEENGERPTFKTRYFCKDLNCGHRGIRYVYDGTEYVRCHKCRTKLKMRFAGGQEPQSENGYFYIADELYVEGMNE